MAKSEFDIFCRDAFRFLEDEGVRYLVVGGLAVLAVGEPRTTADADVIAFLSNQEAEDLVVKAKRAGFGLDEKQELERLRMTGTLRFRRSPFQLDLILASLPFEETAYARAVTKKLFGRLLRFPSPEDLIIFKVLAGRDKDLLDASGVVRRHAKKLDVSYIEEVIRPLCDLAEDTRPWNRLQEVLRKGKLGE